MKIGIIGKGVVGTALYEGFKIHDHTVLCHDKYIPETDSFHDTVAESEIIFICVPTPTTRNGIDLSILDNVVTQIGKMTDNKNNKIIVINSTIVPYTTQKYQDANSDLYFFSIPEFLDSDIALNDFLHPDKIVIGYTIKSKLCLDKLMLLFKSFNRPIIAIKSEEAEMVKYMTNSYYVLKTVFANEIFDICNMLEIDYDTVKEAFIVNRRIGDSHFIPIHKGGRGAGGACLPKDLSAFIAFIALQNSHIPELLIKAQKLNNKILKESGKK